MSRASRASSPSGPASSPHGSAGPGPFLVLGTSGRCFLGPRPACLPALPSMAAQISLPPPSCKAGWLRGAGLDGVRWLAWNAALPCPGIHPSSSMLRAVSKGRAAPSLMLSVHTAASTCCRPFQGKGSWAVGGCGRAELTGGTSLVSHGRGALTVGVGVSSSHPQVLSTKCVSLPTWLFLASRMSCWLHRSHWSRSLSMPCRRPGRSRSGSAQCCVAQRPLVESWGRCHLPARVQLGGLPPAALCARL